MKASLYTLFSLVLWCFALLPTAQPATAQTQNPIAIGESISAELVAPEADYYRLTVSEDNLTELLITVEAETFDALLEIADSSAATLTVADAGGAGTSVWTVWLPPTAGDYLLIVKSADGAGSGLYTLSVNGYTAPEEDAVFSAAIGETVSAQFPGVDEGDYVPDNLWFEFDAEQGDVLDFEVETTNTVINSWIVIYTLDDDQIEYSGASVNPALRQVVIAETGTYRAGVSYVRHTVNDQPVGAFSLTISRGVPLPELTAEPQTIVLPRPRAGGFTSSTRLVFDIEAGRRYHIHLQVTAVTGGESYDIYLISELNTRRPGLCNEQIGAATGTLVTELTCTFTADYTGTMITQIGNFSYPVEVTLEVWIETV